MRMCNKCKIKMEEKESVLKDGTPYKHYYCSKCKDSFLDMKQLHNVAEVFKKRRKNTAKLSRWGVSLGVRIPKELVLKYKLKEKSEVTFIPEENGIRIIV
jgi:hypothetical protein